MGKKKVRINILNWDVEAMYDVIHGNGFIITEKGQIDLNGVEKKTLHGPQSPLFGVNYTDEQDCIEKYRCECGAFKGKMFLGETCPFCGKKIKEHEVNVKMTAWIPFHEHKIINPFYYEKLKRTIGTKVFPDIVEVKKNVDVNGVITQASIDDIKDASSPFHGYGIERFMDDFKEIVDYFKVKKKNKAKELEKIYNERNKVFTSFVPVYTPQLRPQSATSDTLYYTGIDKYINPLVNLSLGLDSAEPIETPIMLSKAQSYVNKMWNYNFDLINSKDGFIKDKLIGGNFNYSARNVIVPDPSLKDNEIDISYQTFRLLFRDIILYTLMKQDHKPLWKVYNRWSRSFVFDSYIYEAMKFIVKNYKPKCLINRNPTLNLYSLLLMSIRNVKLDPFDFTLSLGLASLPGLNADFDGDILNMFGITLDSLKYMLRKYNPTDYMIIDRATGKMNEYFAVNKSQLTDLYHFANL